MTPLNREDWLLVCAGAAYLALNFWIWSLRLTTETQFVVSFLLGGLALWLMFLWVTRR